MLKSPHHLSISTNLRVPGAVVCQVSQMMPSLEGSQELRLWLHHCSSFSLFQRACSLAYDVLRFSSASFVLSFTGARLILSIRLTFCAQMDFFHSAKKQRPCLDSGSGSDVDLLSCVSCHQLSLSGLSCRRSCRVCQRCPPQSDLRCSLPQLS